MTAKRKSTEMSLLSKLKLLIEIDEEDALPTNMCDECVLKLEQSFRFFQQIYIADNALRHIFPKTRESPVSCRVPDDADVLENGAPVPEIVRPLSRVRRKSRGVGRPRGGGRGRRPRTSLPRSPSLSASVSASPTGSPSRSASSSPSPANPASSTEPTTTVAQRAPSDSERLLERRVDGGGTVFSLLTDTCRSDEELDWTDVLKLMNGQSLPEPATRIPCDFCSESFKLRRQLRTHLLADHSEVSAHMCVDCVTCYENESLLVKHRALFHGDRHYRCDRCPQQFRGKSELRQHIVDLHSLEEGRADEAYACDSCDETFETKRQLVEHVERASRVPSAAKASRTPVDEVANPPHLAAEAEGEPSEPAQRPIDEKRAEESVQNRVEDRVVECRAEERREDSPEKRTENESTVIPLPNASALEVDHEKSKDLASCPECEEKIRDGEELAIHRMRSHSIKRKEFACLLCDSDPFPSQEEYERHILGHSKRRRLSSE